MLPRPDPTPPDPILPDPIPPDQARTGLRRNAGLIGIIGLCSLIEAVLQAAMRKSKGKFVDGRAIGVAEVDNWEDIRTYAAALRDRVIDNLDAYLIEFERNAVRRGAKVYWAETAAEANAIVIGIAQRNGVKTITKSKSMVTEEIALNEALIAAGMRVMETDLGEYILQLADDPPSHIVAPAMHNPRSRSRT